MKGMTAEGIFDFCTRGYGASNVIIYNLEECAFKKLLNDSKTEIIKLNQLTNGFYLHKVRFKGQIFCHKSTKCLSYEACSE
jgi:hypothetical protein